MDEDVKGDGPSARPQPAAAGSPAPPAGAPADARRDRWSKHREQRRRKFVDAALRVLEEHGRDLLMDAVAAEAGVSKPVLYRYFSDKSALIDALAERGSEILMDRLLPSIKSDGPALARVRDAVGAYFAVIDEHPNLYWLLARRSNEAGIDSVARDKEFIATTLAMVMSDYLWAFGMDSGGAEPWAHGLTGLVQSTGEWWLQRRSMSRAHVVAYVTQLIWAAMEGTLRGAGITIDPDRPLPAVRPALTLHTTDRPAGQSAAELPRRSDWRNQLTPQAPPHPGTTTVTPAPRDSR